MIRISLICQLPPHLCLGAIILLRKNGWSLRKLPRVVNRKWVFWKHNNPLVKCARYAIHGFFLSSHLWVREWLCWPFECKALQPFSCRYDDEEWRRAAVTGPRTKRVVDEMIMLIRYTANTHEKCVKDHPTCEFHFGVGVSPKAIYAKSMVFE